MRCISRAKSAALVCVALISLFTGGCIGGKGATPVTAYELKNYNQDLYQGKLYAEELCVAQNDVALEAEDYRYRGRGPGYCGSCKRA